MRSYFPRLLLTGLLALVGAASLPRPAPPALASCAATTPAERLDRATAVLRGKVTAVGPGAPTPALQRATFLVDTAWKGSVARELTVLNSPSGSVSGYLELERGQVYLVYAYALSNAPDALGTDACAGTRPAAGAGEDLAALGPGTPIGDPVTPDPPPAPPASDRWTPVAPLNVPRAAHTATLLDDGGVLVAGGDTATAERYDPATGRWALVAPMRGPRSGHTATRLPDGQVLVAGGGPPVDDTPRTAERYDPIADRWTAAAPMGARRVRHTATALPDGRVLVVGGVIPGNAPEAELYDPAADRWRPAASPQVARVGHTATLLTDGTVLVVGGAGDGVAAPAERYDPATDRWHPAGSPLTGRRDHAAVLLTSGEVLVLGGTGGAPADGGSPAALASAERYAPATDAWTAAAPLAAARIAPTATLLSAYGGQVLVTGGGDGRGAILATAERYDQAGDHWFPLPAMGVGRLGHTATAQPLQPTGGILVAGGVEPGGRSGRTAETLALGLLPVTCAPGPPRSCLRERFREYWETNGGLMRFGLPLADEFTETLEDGRPYPVQYFERARLELHPENRPPYDVLVGQFGRRILQERTGRAVAPPAEPLPGQAYFPETGHNLGEGFLQYWLQNGGLAQFGVPISEEFEETLEDGKTYRVQYFERARFEYHPENPVPWDILLGQFGRRILAEAEAGR